jgi:hypothetical protein
MKATLLLDGLLASLRHQPQRIPGVLAAAVPILNRTNHREETKKLYAASKGRDPNQWKSALAVLQSGESAKIRAVLAKNFFRFTAAADLEREVERLERLLQTASGEEASFRKEDSPGELSLDHRALLKSLEDEVSKRSFPWLGTVTPTGSGERAFLLSIARFLRKICGKSSLSLILSRNKEISPQRIADFLSLVPLEEIGRFDEAVKDPAILENPAKIMIASASALLPKIVNFPRESFVNIIIEEASAIQEEATAGILFYFGFGKPIRQEATFALKPESSRGIVIGLGADETSLEGYHIVRPGHCSPTPKDKDDKHNEEEKKIEPAPARRRPALRKAGFATVDEERTRGAVRMALDALTSRIEEFRNFDGELVTFRTVVHLAHLNYVGRLAKGETYVSEKTFLKFVSDDEICLKMIGEAGIR